MDEQFAPEIEDVEAHGLKEIAVGLAAAGVVSTGAAGIALASASTPGLRPPAAVEQAENDVNQLGREEENESLNGSGYPALPGVLGRSGLATAISAGTTGTLANPMLLAEAIFKQRTAIRTTAFVEPDAAVINPTTPMGIRVVTKVGKT